MDVSTDVSVADSDTLNLTLAPTAENAAVARHAVADLASRQGLHEAVRSSAEVVVTEAFTNATRHAYPGEDREPVQIIVNARGDLVEITVRDRGEGFRPRPAAPDGGGRMGLLLIAALAENVRLLRLPDGGTEVRAAVTSASAVRAMNSA